MGWAGRRWILRLALGTAGVVGSLALARWEPLPAALAGDVSLAKFLLKGGKDDLAKKLYDQALTKFERAEREDPTLLEAVYHQALTFDRKGDPGPAIQTYRRYLFAMNARGPDAAVSKEDAALVKKARERLDALDAGTSEYRKADAAFVESVIAFARANLAKDPGITAEALRTVLAIHPDNLEAKRLLDRLPAGARETDAPPKPEGTPQPEATGPATTDMSSITNWNDFLAAQYFGTRDGWTYEDDLLRIDHEEPSALLRSSKKNATRARFAFELECRLVEAYERDGYVGFAFGIREDDYYTLLMTEKAVVLRRRQSGEETDVSHVDMVPGGTGVWHRIGVVVLAKKVQIWLDGKNRGEHEIVPRANLTGDVALAARWSKAEVRLIRLADDLP